MFAAARHKFKRGHRAVRASLALCQSESAVLTDCLQCRAPAPASLAAIMDKIAAFFNVTFYGIRCVDKANMCMMLSTALHAKQTLTENTTSNIYLQRSLITASVCKLSTMSGMIWYRQRCASSASTGLTNAACLNRNWPLVPSALRCILTVTVLQIALMRFKTSSCTHDAVTQQTVQLPVHRVPTLLKRSQRDAIASYVPGLFIV